MSARNLIIVTILGFVYFASYFLFSLLLESYMGFWDIGAPLFFGVTGYVLVSGKRVFKALLSSLTPVFSLPWAFLFLDVDRTLFGIIIIHLFLIGMVIVQIYEAFEWIIKKITKKEKKIREHKH